MRTGLQLGQAAVRRTARSVKTMWSAFAKNRSTCTSAGHGDSDRLMAAGKSPQLPSLLNIRAGFNLALLTVLVPLSSPLLLTLHQKCGRPAFG